jgi:type I restriction enzyme M protein
LHGIDRPAIWHGNTLTKSEIYAGLFEGAPSQFDVILTNPPFGGKEGEEAQLEFAYKTSATQILFLQHILDSLKAGGRAAVVLDEGVSFRLETAFVQTKRKLLSECGSIMVLSLPPGTFINAGAGVKTNIYFFSKLEHGAKPTEKIWYYDLSTVKVGKRTPLTIDRFDQFFALKDSQADSERSWLVDIAARRASAKQQSDPLRAQAQALEESAKTLTASLKAARSKLPADQREIVELEQQIKTAKASATELLGKAQKIDDAVFDLKAVNPNAKTDTDERTPEELLEFIEQKGQEVRSALEMLRGIQSMSA